MDLTLGQLKTYIALCDMAGAKGTCWPSYATIGRQINQTARAVKKHIPVLEKLGLIATTRKGTSVNHYKILELVPTPSEPQDTSKLVNSKTPASEPQDTSLVNTGSQELVNGSSPKQTQENKPKELNNVTNVTLGRDASLDAQKEEVLTVIDEEEFPLYGDKEIATVINKFELEIGIMPRKEKQRQAAKTLLQRHGLDEVIDAINYAAEAQGEDFAPTIANLEDLRDKWINARSFFLKKTALYRSGFRQR